MEAESDLVNLVAWDKFVSNQVTKQSADNVYHPCLFFFFLEKEEFWLLVK